MSNDHIAGWFGFGIAALALVLLLVMAYKSPSNEDVKEIAHTVEVNEERLAEFRAELHNIALKPSLAGPPGRQGERGIPGPTGAQGAAGDASTPAYNGDMYDDCRDAFGSLSVPILRAFYTANDDTEGLVLNMSDSDVRGMGKLGCLMLAAGSTDESNWPGW